MRLARWHRVVATLLAFWLPFVVGKPAMAQTCPMHAPAAMQHEMAHHHDQTPHGAEQHQCVCVGCCASPVAIDASDTMIVTIVVSRSPDAGRLHATLAAPSDAGRRLGLYTTGPPATAPAL